LSLAQFPKFPRTSARGRRVSRPNWHCARPFGECDCFSPSQAISKGPWPSKAGRPGAGRNERLPGCNVIKYPGPTWSSPWPPGSRESSNLTGWRYLIVPPHLSTLVGFMSRTGLRDFLHVLHTAVNSLPVCPFAALLRRWQRNRSRTWAKKKISKHSATGGQNSTILDRLLPST
jgi:hypothetical protein